MNFVKNCSTSSIETSDQKHHDGSIMRSTFLISLTVSLIIFWATQATASTVVTIRVEDSKATGLSGVEVQYHLGEWKTIGNTDQRGEVTIELSIGTYTFQAIHNGARSRIDQDIGKDARVVFRITSIATQSN